MTIHHHRLLALIEPQEPRLRGAGLDFLTLLSYFSFLSPSLCVVVKMPVIGSSHAAVLRQSSQFLTRRTAVRHASSDTATKAKESATSAVSKASEGLSRVTSSAGPILANATKGLRNAGGRTGKVVAFVDCKLFPLLFVSMDSSTRLACLFNGGRLGRSSRL